MHNSHFTIQNSQNISYHRCAFTNASLNSSNNLRGDEDISIAALGEDWDIRMVVVDGRVRMFGWQIYITMRIFRMADFGGSVRISGWQL